MPNNKEQLIERMFKLTNVYRNDAALDNFERIASAWLEDVEKAREEGAIEFRNRLSTNGRPLGAEPLIEKQPVPCPECGAIEYAAFAMYPHQIYNAVYPGGGGHPCVPCFAKRVLLHTELFKETQPNE